MAIWMPYPQKDQLQLHIYHSFHEPHPCSLQVLFGFSFPVYIPIALYTSFEEVKNGYLLEMWYQQQTSEIVLLNSSLMTQGTSFVGAAYRSTDEELLTGEGQLKGIAQKPHRPPPHMSSNSQRLHPWNSLSRFQAAWPGSYPQAIHYHSDNPGEWA